MNNRYLLENSYNANYEAAKKFVENFDWVAAKEAFTKAALAAGELMKISSGVEAAEYRAKATSIVQMIDQIDMKINAAKGPEKNANGGNDGVLHPRISIKEAYGQLFKQGEFPKFDQLVYEYLIDFEFQSMKTKNGLSGHGGRLYHMAFFVESEEEAKKIATVFSRILVAYEKLTKGQVVEATYEDLVGNAVGQSYQKTTEYIKKATGGILLIHNANTLCKPLSGWENEALDTLYCHLNDEDIVMVFSGEEKQMDNFLNRRTLLRCKIAHSLHYNNIFR